MGDRDGASTEEREVKPRDRAGGGHVTLRDIAARVGVSVAAVSRALNGYPDVSERTRRRVLKAARELNYRPNAAAKTLVTRRSQLIGLFFLGESPERFSDPFASRVVDGLLEGLAGAGYDVLIFPSGPRSFRPSFLESASRRQLDGAVFLGLRTDDPRWDELARLRVPLVSVDVPLDAASAVCVGCDHVDGARQAVRHLLELGHRRVAYVNGHRAAPVSWERLAGFTRALEEAGMPVHPDYVAEGDFTEEGGRRAARALLTRSPRPTAVFAASDRMAIGVVEAAREMGLQVPHDLSVVGYDDIDAAAYCRPPLTTVHQPRREIGLAAAEAAVRLIESSDLPPPSRILLRPYLVVRQTTAAAARDEPQPLAEGEVLQPSPQRPGL